VAGISRRALAALAAHHWPGNIRRLEREIARAVLFTGPGELLETAHLSDEIAGRSPRDAEDLKSRVERFEANEIRRTLELCGGSVPEAAEALGLSVSTLYRKINRHGLPLGDAEEG
jgi:transcriptional regulator with PAS, ATPase and Fis domain